jgi:hypothetical protein
MNRYEFGSCVLAAALALCAAGSAVRADEKNHRGYFYNGRSYGSESLINPVTLVLQGTYGILQMGNRSKDPSVIPYRDSWINVRDNLLHPVRNIREYGTWEFLREQVIPFSINNEKAYYWPNYTLHVVGGGMSYRMMVEWFSLHRYPLPAGWALCTISAYHLFNEIVENNNFKGNNVDPIADAYIFNPLGIVLFSVNPVARFFGETLNLSDWSYQIGYDPVRGVLFNNGQNYMMRWRLPHFRGWYLTYYFGNHGEVGFSHQRNETDCWTVIAGFSAGSLRNNTGRGGVLELTADLVGTAGFFYDRNKSLLFSALLSNREENMLRINLYPGMVRLPVVSPGFFFTLDKNGRGACGLSMNFLPLQPGMRF